MPKPPRWQLLLLLRWLGKEGSLPPKRKRQPHNNMHRHQLWRLVRQPP
jgi:hypothetical protein